MSQHKLSWFLKLMLFVGLAFLYIPLFVLVIYSFNESKLVTVSGRLFHQMVWPIAAKQHHTRSSVALAAHRIGVVVCRRGAGHAGGLRAGAHQAFSRQHAFAGMVSAPMVMPDVITGLSMLLLIIQVQMFLPSSEL